MRDSGKLSAAAILIGCCTAHFAVLFVGAPALAGYMTGALFPALAVFGALATYAIWRRFHRKKP